MVMPASNLWMNGMNEFMILNQIFRSHMNSQYLGALTSNKYLQEGVW